MGFKSTVARFLPRKVRELLALRMIREVLTRWLPPAWTEDIMGGWKTWAAAILAIATGVATGAKTVVDGDFSFEALSTAVEYVVAGLGLIGIGHKIEKGKS